jgi:selenocysteine lyase/cysteine desulfurase
MEPSAAAKAAEPGVHVGEPSNRAIAARYGLDPSQRAPVRHEHVAGCTRTSCRACWTSRSTRRLNEYPDSAYEDLTAAAARYVGVPEEEIVVGAGADEILDLVAKAFLPGRRDRRPADPHVRDVRRAL